MHRLAVIAIAATACGRWGFPDRPRDAAPAADAERLAIAVDAAIDASQPDAPAVDAGVDNFGCADGTREAFADLVAFPTIAGCVATWGGTLSLRSPSSGGTCGNDLGDCAQPADTCSPGWHVCSANGDPTEISARVSATDCMTAGGASGAFVAGTSHCMDVGNDSCVYVAPYGCYSNQWCSEPVCCGDGCHGGEACTDGVYDGLTYIYGVNTDGCGALPSAASLGVLCCL